MKKDHSIVRMVLAVIIASALLFPVTAHSQDLTETQKQERCQNNRNRLAELEKELAIVEADLRKAPQEKEIEEWRTEMIFIKRMKNIKETLTEPAWNKVYSIARQYEFDYDNCASRERIINDKKDPAKVCMGELEMLIAKKINKGLSYNRRELVARKANVEKQIARHRTNIIALGCDNSNKNSNEEYIKKLVGGWTDKPTPWGTPGGPCQIKYVNGKLSLVNENKDESDATVVVNSDGTAVINAGKWPVTGTVNKAGNSITWSNGSEWVR